MEERWGMVAAVFKVAGVLIVSRGKRTPRFWEQAACQICAVNYVKMGAGRWTGRETS